MNKQLILLALCAPSLAHADEVNVTITNTNNPEMTSTLIYGGETVTQTFKLAQSAPSTTTQKYSYNDLSKPIVIENNNNMRISQVAQLSPVQNRPIPPMYDSQAHTRQTHIQTNLEDLPKPSFFQKLPSLSSLLFKLASPVKIISLSALGLYGSITAKLVYDSYQLSKKNSWASWQADVSLEILASAEQKHAQELFEAIQKKYASKPLTAHFLSPLIYFMNDINAELKAHQQFLKIHKLLNTLKVAPIFPQQKNQIEQSIIKIKRLEFFKHLIVTYVGEYEADGNQ